ncbi:MAG TPA: EVE domain-containing protein [Longimicrobium sp.]|jgi:hypothetical protein|uniref:EVE domain-containing protein n=1 Tax=Longimicrobium sp. TaxID=2029185 RepID=UPI002ED9322C
MPNTTDAGPRFWINTVSREHVMRGVEAGITQADHGAARTIGRLRRGDWLVFYSPRTAFQGGAPLQSFTAIGRVVDDEPFQVPMTPTFHPWRRKLEFVPHAAEAPIRPLVDDLSFIADKAKWGFPFRRGLFPVPAADFARIAAAMGVAVPEVETAALAQEDGR